ncbi:MAG TPA: amidohydrolase family protein [Bryobacteraceae bacterium]|nr:amidohydrolase family protein [Bryobacteraceae bacterium]
MPAARHLLFLCLLSSVLCFDIGQAQAPNRAASTRRVAIRAARLLDGQTDKVLKNATVLVEGDRITAVSAEPAIPVGTTLIDLGDATLLPGLIDAHTHLLDQMDGTKVMSQELEMLRIVATESTAERALLGAKLAREVLEAGITSVRDLGNSGVNGDVALRTAIRNGWAEGPRIVPSTRALAPPGGQFGRLTPEAQKLIEQEYVTINGEQSARQAVRQALYDGAGCIKVIANGPANVTFEEMKAIVEEAHLAGVKVAAHAIGNQATRVAAEAGVDSIEHAYVVPDDVLRLMAAKHIFLVPTDTTLRQLEEVVFGGRDPAAGERAQVEQEFKHYLDGNRDRLQRALKMGVPIAAGSDMYLTVPGKNRGQASLDVLEAYYNEGMTPIEVIRSATSRAAELLGLQDSTGTLEVGKVADIIAVPGDPLQDVTVLGRAKFVMKAGEVVKNSN